MTPSKLCSEPVRRASRRAAFVSCLVALALIAPVAGAKGPRDPRDSATLTVMFENDLFGDSDEQYTSGFQLGWMSPDVARYLDADLPPGLEWAKRLAAHLPFVDLPHSQHNVGLSLGQKVYTPGDTQTRAVVLDDRPYAGWLYGGIAFISKTMTRLDTVELQAGMIGPASLAEDAQKFVHKLRGFDVPQGWDNQLENEPGLALIYERRDRPWRSANAAGLGYDFITHGGGAVGNVFTYLNAGAELRAGWNLPADFGTSVISPGGDTNAPTAVDDPRLGNTSPIGLHGFAAITGRFVLRDIFLDGNTFADSHDVDKHLLVGDFLVGASLTVWRAKLSYATVFRSKEFEGQDRAHHFGSLSLSITF
ncbi:MAG TPA: lipid A deacylase LpxR family protein [Gammaproteobacteria bacterium]|nr:lipid A deacylase LpxR family protein [Gammaproteobacteria bacterium]